MSKYRTIKVEEKNGSNTIVSCYYKLQKKILFWWFNISIPTACPVGYDIGPTKNCFIYHVYRLYNLETITKVKENLDSPNIINYKGNKIIKVLDYMQLDKFLYLNKSNTTATVDKYDQLATYSECANTLEELQNRIDNRIKTTKIEVI